jgi:PAS domain S-box-containing protein
MTTETAYEANDLNAEITAEVRKLHASQRRLQELTIGEVDAVVHPGGHAYLLHKAQGQLQQKEAEQRHLAETQISILNALPAQIALLDSLGVIDSVNEAWRLFAKSNELQGPEFFVGQNYLEICERASGDCSEEAHAAAIGIRQVLQGEVKDFAMEYPCHSPAEQRWFHLIVAPVHADLGTGAVVMHINITERKLAEMALKDSQSRYRSLFENMLEGYAYCRILFEEERATDLMYLEVNDSFERLTGLKNVIGKKVSEVIPGILEADPELFEMYVRVASTGHPENREIYLKSLGIWLSISVYSHQKDYFTAVFENITERKRTEMRMRQLVDSNVQGVIFWKRNGGITGANDAFLRLVGHTREDLETGRINWMALTPPEYAHLDRHALEEIAATGICSPYEKEFLLRDGSRVPVLLGSAAFEDNPDEGVCYFIDLTERKKLEHQFLRAQRMESIGTLAGGIAHDLNNILAPITMSIHLLKDSVNDPQSRDILETIEVSAKRGADIVRQVLTFARGVEGEKNEIQPNHLLKDIESIIKDTFPKDIRMRFSIPNDTWSILGDPTQVHQILLNLCVNARDAMPNGGNLTVGVENCVLDEHYSTMNIEAKPGRYVNISVTDTGTGMPPALIDKIFDPFFTTKELNKGTGLGLSTVMAIVKSHEGLVNVYSEPGKGTTFKVYLPAIEGASDASKALTGKITLRQGKGETVLVVDDEASILNITKRTLQTSGYVVLTASNGADALAVYLEHKDQIAVVLTDMMMPVMDGPAMIHALMLINPQIKIIAASGLNANGGSTKTPLAGVKHFLTKPYTARILLNTIQEIIDEA